MSDPPGPLCSPVIFHISLCRSVNTTLRCATIIAIHLAAPLGAQVRRPAPASPPPPVAVPTEAVLRLTAALLLPDLTMRPVPLHSLDIIAERDSAVRQSLRTGVDGIAIANLGIGRYVIRSVQPVTLNDSSFRWDVTVDVTAVGARTPGATEQTVEQALAERRIVRTWPMRGTIHFVAPADVRWMLALLAPRVIKRSQGRLRQLGLDQATLTASAHVIASALEGGKQRTRPALYTVLELSLIHI